MFSTLQSCGRKGSDFAHSRTTLQANFNLQFQFIMYTKNRSRSLLSRIVTLYQYTNQVSGATAADSSGVPSSCLFWLMR
jgi:hypothetical protein